MELRLRLPVPRMEQACKAWPPVCRSVLLYAKFAMHVLCQVRRHGAVLADARTETSVQSRGHALCGA